MNIPEDVIREAFYDFPQIPGRTYGEYIQRGAQYVAEWARAEALREAKEVIENTEGGPQDFWGLELAADVLTALAEGTPEGKDQ